MALIFARLARNYIKAGYFPTDEESIASIANLLRMPDQGNVRMLDPCCGEGTALADLRQLLTVARGSAAGAEAFGIELDRDRARHAKQILDRVLQADIHDVIVRPRSMGRRSSFSASAQRSWRPTCRMDTPRRTLRWRTLSMPPT